MKPVLPLLIFITLISPPVFQSAVLTAQDNAVETASEKPISEEPVSEKTFSAESLERNLEGPIDAEDIAAASGWATSSGIVDWLGPLAPVALSPFFGVTCLSGLALWGPTWMTDNAILGTSGPLKNEWLFFVFLGLTLLTSLPRLTKVSKPFAQAVDRLETYAVIVILLVIKLVMSMDNPGIGEEAVAVMSVKVMHFGVVSFTLDTLLSIAMVINILVINSVKFFFEFLVWLTPVPFLDAVFEVCNKSLCAALMAVYALSPTIATGINLVVLLVAALMLRWISRRVRFYRTMILDPVLAKLWTGFGKPRKPELIVFPQGDFGPFHAKSRLKLSRSDDQLVFCEANWWMPSKQHCVPSDPLPVVKEGWVMNSIELTGEDGNVMQLRFSRRYSRETLIALLEQLGLGHDQATEIVEQARGVEFA
ncbi:hypothetical protein Pla22_31020 [Rubripirellula amarantea]|uniref:Uncharacterized protein n=1 Tax=Rubripirellula amarantea TaxID=2527999 RepID=A0A5C5WI55_9BACT|nr:hypothetical protein [Rubripirellula amarantea]TWT50360.1 hypothetical protein Pla22_31020 [Rubripirellula amarantea]